MSVEVEMADPGTAAAMPMPHYICPFCHSSLTLHNGALHCQSEGRRFELMDTAYVDFAPELNFDDWWVQSEQTRQRWLREEAPREEEYQCGVTRNYTMPLLRRLGLQPERTSVLSAACGLAADVEALNAAGYAAWGIDLGSRTLVWSGRRSRVRLARANLLALPFPNASFDFVQCLNVIEHIGTVGDTTQVAPDYWQQRQQAVAALLRVVRPGGYLLLSGVSRHFPLDFFHLQASHRVRIHSPWEKFSLSASDYGKLASATGYAAWTRPLPLRGFFAWTNLRHNRLLRPMLPLANWCLGSLPAAFYGSPLSFFTVVLIRRASAPLPLC